MPTVIKFGTDGWRAIIAEEYTFDNVRICAQAVADYLKSSGQAERGLVIGYDTRFASERFAAAAAEVTTANGIKTLLCDRAQPTPVVSFSVIKHAAGGGIVITASHNPGSYNGFKYKPDYGGSASPEVIAALEERIDWIEAHHSVRRGTLEQASAAGTLEYIDPTAAYLDRVREMVDLAAVRDAGLTIVADAMYGTGAGYFHKLLDGGKTRVIGIRQERNPAFPGIAPEPIMANLAASVEAIEANKADVGLATDGDSDRVGALDENGVFINQHQVYALLYMYLLETRGKRGAAVRSVTSSIMADRLAQRYGETVYETPVGFKYIGPKMMETGAIMGGEESGGFGFAGHIPERDAIVSGAMLLDLMVRLGRPMSGVLDHLRDQVGSLYYNRVDVHFPPEKRQQILDRVGNARLTTVDGSKVVSVNTADGYKFILDDDSWLLVRFSGTEPLLRIYTETTSPERVERILAEGRRLAGV
ncbi:MAG: phosphoglucomutase/phosphomannomutase family protein [Chloroflexi bacterium]|nr:phosphoglucomutase/phosphomannomutase family protein [Chloroflexota bacterium]